MQIIPHYKCPLPNAVLKMIVDISQLDKGQDHKVPALRQVRLLLPPLPLLMFPRLLPPLQVRPLQLRVEDDEGRDSEDSSVF
jgi:hypothetical protein